MTTVYKVTNYFLSRTEVLIIQLSIKMVIIPEICITQVLGIIRTFAADMKKIVLSIIMLAMTTVTTNAQDVQNKAAENSTLQLVNEWDKTFPKSDKVRHEKVTFRNRFGIMLAADLYVPKEAEGKMAAIAVSGPFGAVKEQASGLYAQRIAEEGFLTIAFDPSFTGESGGEPRYSSSMDINTEDFCAAVDYLSCRDDVDAGRIGILGICGWGGIALNAAALDPRVKATVSVTLYNMTRVTQQGYFDSMDEDARFKLKQQLAEQRTEEYRKGEILPQGGLPAEAPSDAPDFFKQYIAYYKSEARGYHPRSLNSNMGWKHHLASHAPQPEPVDCSRRDTHSRTYRPRREGSQPILRRGGLSENHKRQICCGQASADSAQCHPLRPIRRGRWQLYPMERDY